MFFVNDVFPDMGGTKSDTSLWLYVADVDASFQRAVDAGGKPTMPEDLTTDEMKAAEKAFIEQTRKTPK